MPTSSQAAAVERARQWLKRGGIAREDSDDELGTDDLPWEWIYADESRVRGKASAQKQNGGSTKSGNLIVGARMGGFECRLGDTVLLKAEGKQAWVGLITQLKEGEDEDGGIEKLANFMWFSSPDEIRNKLHKRTDYLPNELYISPSWDDNPLSTINGKALIMSKAEFDKHYPTGKIARSDKDYGKIFVCRRGCNTRTATYTNEFKWEDVYRGVEDLIGLISLVESQTKKTRKKLAQAKRDLDEFVADDEGDPDAPKTPRKKRRIDPEATTPVSKKANITPRKLLTLSRKRITLKRPLEFTPLGTRILSPSSHNNSPHQQARSTLHVSHVPAALPCREEEFSSVYSHLESAITSGLGTCIYISGTPGTGKTATVREVVASLNASVQAEMLDDFIFVEINGMKLTDPHQAYSLLWEALRGDRVSPAHAIDLLEREFNHPSPRRVPCVVLMDELDQLVTRSQSVMYNFFNWPQLAHSRLIVLAVANTMDLPERTLSNKISSRLGLTRIQFAGYTHAQLIRIVESRLEGIEGAVVDSDAVQFASRKVAAVSGDARRCLDICRRAVEIAEQEALEAEKNEHNMDDTPSRRKEKHARPPGEVGATANDKRALGKVTITIVKQAIQEATSSPMQQYLRHLPLSSKVFLGALLARLRRTGIGEAALSDVVEEAKRMGGTLTESGTVRDFLVFNDSSFSAQQQRKSAGAEVDRQEEDSVMTRKKTGRDLAPRVLALGYAAMELCEAGIVGLEPRRGERTGKIRLCVRDEEIKAALRDDAEARGLGIAG